MSTYYVIYIIWYLHTIIYILVDTYYVINGITIIKYLHNGNYHNGGNAGYIATLCATGKTGLCVCCQSCYALNHAMLAIGLGNGFV